MFLVQQFYPGPAQRSHQHPLQLISGGQSQWWFDSGSLFGGHQEFSVQKEKNVLKCPDFVICGIHR